VRNMPLTANLQVLGRVFAYLLQIPSDSDLCTRILYILSKLNVSTRIDDNTSLNNAAHDASNGSASRIQCACHEMHLRRRVCLLSSHILHLLIYDICIGVHQYGRR
jgi:hypothetical protein